MTSAITPFTLDVPQADLDDLRDRLLRTRWPDAETVEDTSQGPRLAEVRRLVDRWTGGYDWRAAEALLNGWGQFTTVVDGLEIHFLHVRSAVPGARPLLLTHGWPGSVLEFRALFMPTDEELRDADAAERAMVAESGHYWQHLSAYSQQMSTRPQTIGYSLADSPVGLATWIYSLVQDVSGSPDQHGDVEAVLATDDLLDDIMLYWLPNAGASAARMYWEQQQVGGWSAPGTVEDPLTVPVGLSIMPGEYLRRSRRWAERRYPDLVLFNEVARGGHFALLEQPDLLVADIRATFRGLSTP